MTAQVSPKQKRKPKAQSSLPVDVPSQHLTSDNAEPSNNFDPDSQTCCGQPLRFDADRIGETCGGLELQGWMTCDVCGGGYLDPLKRGKPTSGKRGKTEATSSQWAVASSGRSMTCGSVKLRAESGAGDSAAIRELLERIAKLPELEAEVARLTTELEARAA